ncbi:MAG: carboxypeptidase-like regulatory domain-containing protein [bacterium]
MLSGCRIILLLIVCLSLLTCLKRTNRHDPSCPEFYENVNPAVVLDITPQSGAYPCTVSFAAVVEDEEEIIANKWKINGSEFFGTSFDTIFNSEGLFYIEFEAVDERGGRTMIKDSIEIKKPIPLFQISGTVFDSNTITDSNPGKILGAGARVILWRHEKFASLTFDTVYTGENGMYIFHNVPGGTGYFYRLSFYARHFQGNDLCFSPDDTLHQVIKELKSDTVLNGRITEYDIGKFGTIYGYVKALNEQGDIEACTNAMVLVYDDISLINETIIHKNICITNSRGYYEIKLEDSLALAVDTVYIKSLKSGYSMGSRDSKPWEITAEQYYSLKADLLMVKNQP